MKRILSVVVILTALAGAQSLVAQDKTVALLQQLTDAPGPPGFEEPIRKVMVDLMKPLAVVAHLRRPRLDHRDAGHDRVRA